AAAADSPEECASDGVFALPRRVELVVDDGTGPGAIRVDVVGEARHTRDVRARRPLRDLTDGERSVRSLEPLHVRHSAVEAEGTNGALAHRSRRVVRSAVDFARENARPLNPGVLENLEATRQIP